MEDVLEVYSRPYDETRPVVCMDEKPVQLNHLLVGVTLKPKSREQGLIGPEALNGFLMNNIPLQNKSFWFVITSKLHTLFYDLLKEYHIPECMMPLVEKMVIDILSSQNVEASLRKKMTEIDKDMKDCHLRHATGKIADETFSVAIQALEERKGEILLGIENIELSNAMISLR